ncbi:hypothetical protein C8R43DRAFT_847118, partial [Mycena crocata]
TSRTLMRQMINSMSTKMEIGSPMASMYLLGNPDHYKSHEYVNFAWRSYVAFVRNFWGKQTKPVNDTDEDKEDLLTVRNQDGTFVAASVVDDYRYRPVIYESLNLYEWIQCSEKKARTKGEQAEFLEQLDLNRELDGIINSRPAEDELSDDGNEDEDDLDFENAYKMIRHSFLVGHDFHKSHSVHCDFRKLDYVIPNFLGGAIPRADKGDREYYCVTMMTLFKAWRTPADLKDSLSSWDETFIEHEFTPREEELIGNFNIRYECNDARDDHYAIMKKKMAERGEQIHPVLGNQDKFRNDVDDLEFGDEELLYGDDILIGRRMQKLLNSRSAMKDVLQDARWLNTPTGLIQPSWKRSRLMPIYKARRTWTELVKAERKRYTQNKLADLPPQPPTNKQGDFTNDKVEILPHDHFNPKSHFTKEMTADLIKDICREFALNTEQERAFRIVAEHASAPQPTKLKMYLGGMGGSGKSRVFHSIIEFFKRRKEEYRYIVLGPTGSTAALLNGST